MLRTAMLAIAQAFAIMVSVGQDAIAQGRPTFATYHINPVMKPRGLEDAVRECLQDRICRQMLDAAAASLGIPTEAIAVAHVASMRTSRNGEDTRFIIAPPEGYKVCRVSVRTVSLAPRSGDRASLLGVSATSERVSASTWTPKQGYGKGRSWYDGYLTVLFVPVHDQRTQCAISSNVSRMVCRGDGRSKHRQQACGYHEL